MKNTITVSGHFGDKEVTRESFIDQWLVHVTQLNRLVSNEDGIEWVQLVKMQTEEIAGQEFDKTLKAQK